MSNWKEDITKRKVYGVEFAGQVIFQDGELYDDVDVFDLDNVSEETLKANTMLVEETFNVFNETNKTPREQQETIKELLGALINIRNACDGNNESHREIYFEASSMTNKYELITVVMKSYNCPCGHKNLPLPKDEKCGNCKSNLITKHSK